MLWIFTPDPYVSTKDGFASISGELMRDFI
jgi:hypothetical protein